MTGAQTLSQIGGAVLLLLTAGAAPALAQGASALTLAQAMERALAANRTIAAARLQRPVDIAGIALAA